MSTRADLERFAALLIKWNAVQNLVSRETIDQLWPRHIEDSLRLVPLIRENDRQIVDLGSGGGFPAIPLAVAMRDTGRHITLVEPIAKKAAFLRTAIRELGLDATVLAKRGEDIDSRETFDCVTSRALASLDQLLAIARPLLKAGGHLLLHKGRNYRQELDAAAAQFAFDVLVHESESGDGGVILDVTNLRVKSAG